MLKVQDIYSLSEFQRNTKAHLSRLKKTQRPEVLTVNGKAEVVVLAAETFQKISDALEQVSAIEGIRRGLESMERGEGRPVEEFFRDFEKRFGVAPR